MTAQLVRYATVGVSNTVLTFVTYLLLHRAGVPPVPAAAVAFLVGAANGYRWNSRWTFNAVTGRDVAARYLVVQLIGRARGSRSKFEPPRSGVA